MKLKLVLAALTLFSASTAVADIVEGNLSFSLTVHEQNPVAEVGPNKVGSYRTYTIKNADIIQMIGVREGRVFTKKAKMIWQTTYTAGGQSGYSYRIREQGQEDLMITTYISLGTSPTVRKYKISSQNETGTVAMMGLVDLKVPLNGAFEGLYMTGPIKSSMRIVKSLQFPNIKVTLSTQSMTVAGKSLLGSNPVRDGYVTGTYKISGMKFIK